METLDWLSLFSIISSFVSIAIGAFAIWLAVTFYKMSTESSRDIKSAATNIEKTVERLEAVFDKMYSDTFSMVKDTVTDMRRHVWKAPEEKSLEQSDEYKTKIGELKSELSDQLNDVLAKQAGADKELGKLKEDLERLLEAGIEKSREVDKEIKESEIRKKIIFAIPFLIDKRNKKSTLENIANLLGLEKKVVVDELFEMAREGLLYWEGYANSVLDTKEEIDIIDSNRVDVA